MLPRRPLQEDLSGADALTATSASTAALHSEHTNLFDYEGVLNFRTGAVVTDVGAGMLPYTIILAYMLFACAR